jgi:hypothetical protein
MKLEECKPQTGGCTKQKLNQNCAQIDEPGRIENSNINWDEVPEEVLQDLFVTHPQVVVKGLSQ